MALFVGNVSFDSTEESVKKAFEAHGSVTKLRLLRGYAFVTLGSDDGAASAIKALDGSDLDGRNIAVKPCRPRDSSGSRGRGRGRGRGRKNGQPLSRPLMPRDPALEGVDVGFNVNSPVDEMILSGKKTVETRGYAVPEEFIGVRLAIVRCRGESKLPQRIVGTVTFGKSSAYQSEEAWSSDFDKHCVEPGHKLFGWKEDGEIHAWPITDASRFDEPILPPSKKHLTKSFYTLLFADQSKEGAISVKGKQEGVEELEKPEKPVVADEE